MQSLKRLWFDHVCKRILYTEQLVQTTDTFSVLTMLGHSDVLMYLIAIKSFCHYQNLVPRIYVLNDGSLTLEDRMLLREHIKDLGICFIENIEQQPDVPKGGTWERLLLLAELVKDAYIIQLDSDTVTYRYMSEVNECIKKGINFTLSGSFKKDGTSTPNVLAQGLVERNIDVFNPLLYISGNSGFTGFAKGSFNIHSVVNVALRLKDFLGYRIQEWGTEQIASNMLVSNDSTVLLPSSYIVQNPSVNYFTDVVKFAHFITSQRFKSGLYRYEVGKIINILMEADKDKKDIKQQVLGCLLKGEASRLRLESYRLRNTNVDPLVDASTDLDKIIAKLEKIADSDFKLL